MLNATATTPRYSVVIPSRNRAEQLPLTLASWDCQTISPAHFEVIVVDDASTDETGQVVSLARSQAPIRYLRLPERRGQGYARNRGVEAARGERIVFSDADMLAVPRFLAIVEHEHDDEPLLVSSGTPLSFQRVYTHFYAGFDSYQKHRCADLASAAGRWQPSYLDQARPAELVCEHELRAGFHHVRFMVDPQDPPIKPDMAAEFESLDVAPWLLCVTRCLVMRRALFVSAGGFDERLNRGEDWELGYRLHRLGARFRTFSQEMSLHQEHPVIEQFADAKPFYEILAEKFDRDDPELRLLTQWGSSDEVFRNVVVYKQALRALKAQR